MAGSGERTQPTPLFPEAEIGNHAPASGTNASPKPFATDTSFMVQAATGGISGMEPLILSSALTFDMNGPQSNGRIDPAELGAALKDIGVGKINEKDLKTIAEIATRDGMPVSDSLNPDSITPAILRQVNDAIRPR